MGKAGFKCSAVNREGWVAACSGNVSATKVNIPDTCKCAELKNTEVSSMQRRKMKFQISDTSALLQEESLRACTKNETPDGEWAYAEPYMTTYHRGRLQESPLQQIIQGPSARL